MHIDNGIDRNKQKDKQELNKVNYMLVSTFTQKLCKDSIVLVKIELKSLILAQDERWRHA